MTTFDETYFEPEFDDSRSKRMTSAEWAPTQPPGPREWYAPDGSLLATPVREPRDRDGLPELADVSTMRPPNTLGDEYVRGLIRPGKLILIAASEGLGKCYVRKELEWRLATGPGPVRPLPDRAARPRRHDRRGERA